MKTKGKTINEINKMFLDHAYDLHQKGLKYATLKKEYNELRIRHDRAYAKKILAEAKRDKCIEALKTAVHGLKQMNENGKFLNSITIAEQAIKSITND